MPSVRYDIPPLGGIKRDIPAQLLERYFTPWATGVWTRRGQLRRIPGKIKRSTTQLAGGAVMALVNFKPETGGEDLVAISQDKAYKFNTSTEAFDSIQDGTDFTGADTDFFASAQFYDATATEILVLTNYKDAIRKWTGSGNIAVLGGSPPKAKILCVYANFLFLGHTEESGVTYPRRIRWSALANGESYPTDNYGDLRKTPDWLTAMAIMRDRLIIYKDRSISILNYVGGGSLFTLTENYANGPGPLSHPLLVPYGVNGEEHYFIGKDFFIYCFNGIDCKRVSNNLGDICENLNADALRKSSGHALIKENKIVWAVPYGNDTTCKTLIIYDVEDKSWFLRETEPVAISSIGETLAMPGGGTLTWDTLPYPSWDEWDDPDGWDSGQFSGSSIVLLFGHTDGYVRQQLTGVDDDGAPILTEYAYPWDNLDGQASTLKSIHKILLETENLGSGSISLKIYKDYDKTNPAILDEDGNTVKTINLYKDNLDALFVVHEIDLAITAYTFRFSLSGDGVSWAGRILRVDYEITGEGLN